MELGVEDGDADAVGRECVAVGARRALDQPVCVEAEAAQVVAHLPGAVAGAEESGDVPAKALASDAGDGMDDEAQGAGQGHGALIPEAKRSGSLALPYVGLVDALEERRADGTALAGTFDHKQAVVDLARFADEFGQMLEPGQDPHVSGLVYDGLDAKCPPFLEVLLDPAV